jgi:hypothetical protein
MHDKKFMMGSSSGPGSGGWGLGEWDCGFNPFTAKHGETRKGEFLPRDFLREALSNRQ